MNGGTGVLESPSFEAHLSLGKVCTARASIEWTLAWSNFSGNTNPAKRRREFQIDAMAATKNNRGPLSTETRGCVFRESGEELQGLLCEWVVWECHFGKVEFLCNDARSLLKNSNKIAAWGPENPKWSKMIKMFICFWSQIDQTNIYLSVFWIDFPGHRASLCRKAFWKNLVCRWHWHATAGVGREKLFGTMILEIRNFQEIFDVYVDIGEFLWTFQDFRP